MAHEIAPLANATCYIVSAYFPFENRECGHDAVEDFQRCTRHANTCRCAHAQMLEVAACLVVGAIPGVEQVLKVLSVQSLNKSSPRHATIPVQCSSRFRD